MDSYASMRDLPLVVNTNINQKVSDNKLTIIQHEQECFGYTYGLVILGNKIVDLLHSLFL